MDADELGAAGAQFVGVPQRSKVPNGSIAIARYSVLPFYKELEADLAERGSKLINSYPQHQYVADISACTPISRPSRPRLGSAGTSP